MYLLLSKKISESAIKDAKFHFEEFLEQFKSEVGQQFMTLNFHDLYHLPAIAWQISSFSIFFFF